MSFALSPPMEYDKLGAQGRLRKLTPLHGWDVEMSNLLWKTKADTIHRFTLALMALVLAALACNAPLG
jgi:hypothetical protein